MAVVGWPASKSQLRELARRFRGQPSIDALRCACGARRLVEYQMLVLNHNQIVSSPDCGPCLRQTFGDFVMKSLHLGTK